MSGLDLWVAYHRTRDPAHKEQLVLKHLGLVKYLAGRLVIHAPSVMTQEDLEGYGVIGLLDAIEKYNNDYGTEFKNYAYTRIRGAMLDEIRKQNWVPRSKWQKISQINNAKEKFMQDGSQLDESTLAAEMGMDADKLRGLSAEYHNAFPVSLDETSGLKQGHTLADTISDPGSPDPLDVVVENNEKELLQLAINLLPERDRLVMALYYQEELTLKEIGYVLDVTESRVCQLHTKALQKIRETLLRPGIIQAKNKKGARIK